MMKLCPLVLFTASIFCVHAAPAIFMQPPQHVGKALEMHAVNNRGLTMVSSMAVTPGGRLWCTWYAGVTPEEDRNNYVVLATSGDDGKSWEEVLIVDPDAEGHVRAFDPELWLAPDGNLYLLWAQAIGHEGRVSGTWALRITNPEDANPSYGEPVRWSDGIMMCKPIVLSTGEWVLPISTWRETDESARMVVSKDNGKSWQVRGATDVPKDVRSYDEHMIVERKDGSMWMLVRTRYGIGESVSTDRGRTWSPLVPSAIPHADARFYIHRLNSGNLLLVKHGSMNERTGRSHLMAFVSKDDGKSWEGGLLLDERETISYPDGQQAEDGTIYITYDRNRTTDREIFFTTFREEDALAGKAVSADVRFRQLVSKGSGGVAPKPRPRLERQANEDGAALSLVPKGKFEAGSYQTFPFAQGQTIFSDRSYGISEVPEALNGFSLIRIPLEGETQIKCVQSGMLYVLTPRSGRNRDSMEQSLIEQGFSKVALPEFLLFGNDANLCTLYQKNCVSGEVITIGKWAIPLLRQ